MAKRQPPATMETLTRSSQKKASARAVPPSSQAAAVPSSGSTVPDEAIHSRYAMPRTSEDDPERANVSRLSQTLEPLNIAENDCALQSVTNEIDPLGAGVKELFNTMNELEKLGLDKFDIPLAKCIVVGDQSAGKSSVIEAISGIKVPRSAGTCTRCPLYIKLENTRDTGSEWQARVSLRLSYAFLDQNLQGEKYPGWLQNDKPDETLFADTKSPDELSSIIYWAQVAILTPSKDPSWNASRLRQDTNEDSFEVDFSPNCVCIYICSPTVPNLSFYDLPGIIHSIGDRSKMFLVNLVRNLVKEYVADPNALILLVTSLSRDFELSSAYTLVEEENAQGRSLGVLTKPDCLEPHKPLQPLLQTLHGGLYPLHHGYFVVKQPAQDALQNGITHQQARKEEEDFFSQQEPWASKLATYHNKFGTVNLQMELSTKLAQQTCSVLPEIEAQINKQITGIEAQLETIPKPPTEDVSGIVRDVLRTLTDSVRKELLREDEHNRWRLLWDQLREDFKAEIDSLQPTLQTKGSLDKGLYKNRGPEMVDLISSDEEDNGPSTPVSKKRRFETLRPASTPSRLNGFIPSGVDTPTKSSTSPSASFPKKTLSNGRSPLAMRYNLDDTSAALYQMSSAKLSHHTNPKAIAFLMLQSINLWKTPMKRFIDQVEQELSKHLIQLLKEALASWTTTELYRSSAYIVQTLLRTYCDTQRSGLLSDSFRHELDGPYLNDRYFDQHFNHYLAKYKGARLNARAKTYFEELTQETGKEISVAERQALVKKEPAKSAIDKEPYTEVIHVLAQVRGYYEHASIRFQEKLYMGLESDLFKKLGMTLFDKLKADLQITGENVHERCLQLLAEDPAREALRRSLEEKRNVLIEGQEHLTALKQKYGLSSGSQPAQGSQPYNIQSQGSASTPASSEMEDIVHHGHRHLGA